MIEINGVQVVAGGRTILAVEHLAVARGERLAIIGPNGAGKSTLLRTIALLPRPAIGTVGIGGVVATSGNERALRRTIGVLFQEPMLFRGNVQRNVEMGLRFSGVSRDDCRLTVERWMDRLGIGHLARQRVDGLSGGESQRVALARALAPAPDILLLDEPFSALDATTRAAIAEDVIGWLGGTHGASVLVTHDLGEALAFGTTIGVLADGRLLQRGPTAEVMARPASLEAARLLGVENLVPGFVRDVPGGCVIDLGGWGRVAIGQTDHAEGDRVVLAIRAGAIRLLPMDRDLSEGWSGVSGRVLSIRPMPASNLVIIGGGEHVLQVAVPWARGWLPEVGEMVVAAFPREAAHCYPEVTSPASR